MRLRLHPGRHHAHPLADGTGRQGAGLEHGVRHPAGGPEPAEPGAPQLLQAALCPGDQPADRPDPGKGRDEHRLAPGERGEPARRDPRARAAAPAQDTHALRRRSRTDSRADRPGFTVKTISTLFERSLEQRGLEAALARICAEAAQAVGAGTTILILSDRGVDDGHVAVPPLLATAGVHHHLIRAGLRTRCGLIVETGEAREIHHFALLVGYGAAGVNPYLVYETYRGLAREGMLLDAQGTPLDLALAIKNYGKSIEGGLLKIFSKMGISTLASYRGAQIFEAIGLGRSVIDRYFPGTPSRLGGIGLDVIAREALARHEIGYPGAALCAGDGARRRRRAHVAAPRRVPHVEPGDDPETPACPQEAGVRQLPGIRPRRQRREPPPVHHPRPARDPQGAETDPARAGRAGQDDRQAVLHRRDELRLDQQGGTRPWRSQ